MKSLNQKQPNNQSGGFLFLVFFVLVSFLVLVPLLTFKSLLYPFVTGKTFLFRMLIEAAFPLYVYFLAIEKKLRPSLKDYLNFSLLVFVFLTLISTVFGLNIGKSMWGNLERMGGLFTLIHYFALYFYLLLIARQNQKYFDLFFKFLVFSSLIVSLNAISSKFGGPSLVFDLWLEGGRVSSTLGNPIYLGSFLILPMALGLVFMERATNFKVKLLYASAIFFMLWAIFLSATRGALLGIFVGFIVGIFIFLFFGKKNLVKRVLLPGVIIFLLAIFSLFYFKNYLPETFVLRRALEFNDQNTQSRLLQWKLVLYGFKEHFFLGTGPENYNILANKYYEPKQYSLDKSWFDKPHNYFLEILATQGILGLFSYLAVIVLAFWFLYKAFKLERLSLFSFAVLTSGFTAYQTQNFFVFETICASIVFYGYLAFIFNQYFENYNAPTHVKKNFSYANILLAICAVISFYLIYAFNTLPWKMAKLLNSGLTAYAKLSPANYELSKTLFDRADKMNLGFDTTELFYKYSDMALAAAQSSGEVKQEFVKGVLADGIGIGQKAIVENPTNPVNLYYLATLKYFSELANKGENFQETIDNLNKAYSLAPKRPEIYYMLVAANVAAKNYNQAENFAREYYKNYPWLSQSVWQMAWVDYKKNDLSNAGKYALEAINKGYKIEIFSEGKLLADYFSSVNQPEQAVKIYEQLVKTDEHNLQVYLALTEAYYLNRQFNEAKNLANQIILADPAQNPYLEKYLK
jgi:O-antigen ligase